MRSSTLLSLVALAAQTQAVKLRKTEFNVLISSRPALILFTADGCKECDRVEAVLDRVSPVLTKTAIASVNCNDEPTVCDDSQVFTVPTLKFTAGNNELVTYKEALDASSVVKYIERQSGSPVVDLTEDIYLGFARSSRVAVIAFLGSEHQPERKTFDAVAERWRAHYSFGNVHGLEKDSKNPSIAVYTQEEEDPVYYRGPFTVTDVEAFLRDATQPLIREYDPIVHEEAMKDEKPLAQIFFNKRDDRAELVKSLAPLAKKYKDQLSFMTVLAPDYPKRCEQMHLSKDIKRGFAVANKQGRAYPMSETVFNANRVAKHVAAYLAGSLTPSIKSEPVPEVSTSQPFLTKLVGSTFDDLVYDKAKDVLVEFNVPWCQYCTDLHAVMNELGSKYAKLGLSDKVALASINVDANDVPIEIDSYPSIRLYRAGTNEVMSFKGNFTEMLTVEQLDAFIAQSGGHGINLSGRASSTQSYHGGLMSNRLIFDRDSSSRIPLPLFVDLEQESNAGEIALSISSPRSPICRFTPLEIKSLKETSGIYHPLSESSTFRLLEILAGDGDVVHCKLHVCGFQENEAAYEALSYTWGKPDSSSHRKIEIISNGASHSMSISGSLYIALRELRRSNASRVIWADAICINQADVKERGQQVALMGKVFSGAWQVIVWLGEEEDRCMCGNTVLKTSLSSASKAFARVCSVVNDWLAQAGQETLEATYSEISKDGKSTVHHANTNDGKGSRSAMMLLFRRRWFSRIWVLQEAVLARHVIVQLGSFQIRWEWLGLSAAIVVHKSELSPSSFIRDMTPTGAMNSYLMYRLSVSQKCFPRLEFSFAQLLQVSRHFKSKEPKDKIYGLLGIETTDSVGKQVIPDYRETTTSEKVFEDIARLMLKTASPLTFLSGAGTFGDFDRSGPSWVPSWHERRPWTILPTKQNPGFQCASGAPMELHPDNKAAELVLKGVIIDRISSMQEHRDYWGVFDENDKSRDNLLNQPRWSKKAWRKCAMTLSCGGDGRAYPIDDETAHLADLAALVLSGSAHWIIRDLISLRDVMEPRGDEITQAEYLNEIVKGGNSRRYISAVEPVRDSYRLFKTASKDFGVGPVDMKIGDKVCVLFGGEVPFILRPKGDGYFVVGECYVYDLMHGEVLDKLANDPDGPLKAEWIKLI
ncbi:Heterokaryon incompatibility 6 OR allele [Fusarium acutatum]|uniref:Heterokaryon incompatibility 6 OR allele n=1 Tax=Fusarium acutatum TaxID=78861 RepID=A0A8H4NJ19_9HYPO|nr:Heterokaryon incompatibility 6 OR allele [Fusarium acutatum]